MHAAVRAFAAALADLEAEESDPALLPGRLTRAVVAALPVDGAGLTCTFSPDRRLPIGASDPEAAAAERLQFTLGEGPCLTAHAEQRLVAAAGPELSTRWPVYAAQLVARTGYRGVVSAPVPGSLTRVAAVNVFLRHEADTWAVPADDLEAVAAEVAVALGADLADSVDRPLGMPAWFDEPSVTDRQQVWRAIGYLVGRDGGVRVRGPRPAPRAGLLPRRGHRVRGVGPPHQARPTHPRAWPLGWCRPAERAGSRRTERRTPVPPRGGTRRPRSPWTGGEPMGPDLPHDAGTDAAIDAAVMSLHRLFLPDQLLTSLLQRVVELAAGVLPGVAAASITLIQPGAAGATVASSGLLAYELDETQYRSGDGPCLTATTADGPVLLADTASETRWPAFTRHARQRGAATVLSVPVALPRSPEEREQHRRRVLAALNLYGAEAGVFDAAAVRSAERFTAGAATAVANMRALAVSRALVDGLREAVEARGVIEQAKGMVMARRGCTADEAFQLLSTESQCTQRKLRDLAADVVAGRAALG